MEILGYAEPRLGASGKKRSVYRLRCDCGAEFEALAYSIRSGNTKSCGCLRRRVASASGKARRTTGVTVDPQAKRTRSSWKAMMDRCYRPGSASYGRYGAVGIAVHEAWRTYAGFVAGMGLRPGPEYTLERLDSAKNYDPGNVVWATRATQARNRRSTVRITWNGLTLCAQDWATTLCCNISTVLRRHRRGLNPDGSR